MSFTYSGVDWLTMTTREQKTGEHWYRIWVEYKDKVLQDELRIKRWNNGLYAGIGIGHLRWGYSENLGYIFIASSRLAEEYYERFQPAKHKVTRVDLCMDVLLDECLPLAKSQFNKLQIDRPKKVQIKLYQGPAGGDTLYVGSRQSPQCGRLYDKGVEQGIDEPGCLWRFEVEYKKPLSGQVVAQLGNLPPKERGELIAGTVWNWFTDRGVVATEKPIEIDPIDVHVLQQITTREKKLIWLHNQVRPTVLDLCRTGSSRDVFDALGLSEWRRTVQQETDCPNCLESLEQHGVLPVICPSCGAARTKLHPATRTAQFDKRTTVRL